MAEPSSVVVDAIRHFFERHPNVGVPLVVAVSGGNDSTALLVAMCELGGFDIVAGHVNHHLRGEESDADEAFVRELAGRLGVPVHVADGTLEAEAVKHRGIEAAAREVRHARLHEIAAQAGASHVATAHQKNDQAETIVMRLMTGGGIAALRGILPVRDDRVIRPLLRVTRAEIAEFLAARDITPRHDRSNDDPRFLRNRVRAMLRDAGDAAIENLARVADQARAQWQVLERAIDAAEDVEAGDGETRFRTLPDDPWLRQALLHRHIRRLDPASRDVSSDDLARLDAALPSLKRTSVTRTVEILRRGGQIVLRLRPPRNDGE